MQREISTYYRGKEEVTLPYTLTAMGFTIPSPSVYVLQFTSPANLNPMTFKWVSELFFCLEYFERLCDCKVLVLTGSGRAFSSGADAGMLEVLAKGASISPADYVKHLGQEVFDRQSGYDLFGKGQVGFPDISCIGLTRRLLNFSKISISAVNGFAVGGAANISMLLTDYCFCCPASFFRYPFSDRGVPPELGSSLLLPLAVGAARAKHFLVKGERITAQTALSLGLVHRVVQTEEALVAEAVEFAAEFASARNYPGRRLGKKSVNDSVLALLEVSDTLGRENRLFLKSTNTPYFQTVTTLLLSKIKPKM